MTCTSESRFPRSVIDTLTNGRRDGIKFLDESEQPMNLVNTIVRRSDQDRNTSTAYALVLRNDSICIFCAQQPRNDYSLPSDYFDRKYALVARYPIDLFPVGPVEIYVRSLKDHPEQFHGANVVRKLSQSE
jgi:hypothetical protein